MALGCDRGWSVPGVAAIRSIGGTSRWWAPAFCGGRYQPARAYVSWRGKCLPAQGSLYIKGREKKRQPCLVLLNRPNTLEDISDDNAKRRYARSPTRQRRGLRHTIACLSPSHSLSAVTSRWTVHLSKLLAQNLLQRWLSDHLDLVANPIGGMLDVHQSTQVYWCGDQYQVTLCRVD